MGAILAGRVLADHPERVSSATFAGAAPVLDFSDDLTPIPRLKEILDRIAAFGLPDRDHRARARRGSIS